jgi:GH24 family phage-related lysozyme (muramidase)
MASQGTGLPIQQSERVLVQPGPITPMINADAYSNAQSWAQIAQAGARLGDAAGDYAKVEIHQAKVGYLAEQDVEIARKRADLRDQFDNDPQGFDANWTAYKDGKIGAAEPWAVPHLTRQLGNEGNSAYSALLSERRATDRRLDGQRIESLASLTGNDVVGSAMAGTLGTEDGQIKVGKYRAVLDSAVNSGLMVKEKADFLFDDTMSKAQGEIAARGGVEVYRAKGFDAAVDHLKSSILENEGLSLKGESRYKAFNRGLAAIRLERQVDQQDRVSIIEASKGLRASISSNQPVDDGEVRDTLQALQRSGAAAEFKRLSVDHAVATATAPYRAGLDLKTFATAVAGQRVGVDIADAVKRFEGFAPKAQWDHKQFSVGYGTKGAPGETIDRATADLRLNQELGKAADIVDRVNPNLPPGARAALISLTYNAGGEWASAGLGERVKAGDLAGAKALFVQYNKASGEVNPGLVARRNEEVTWFDKDGPGAAPQRGELTGVPFNAEITKRVQAQFVDQARKAWPDFKTRIDQGKVLDQDDFTAVRYAAALSGDANWQKQVEDLAVANGVGKEMQALPASEQQAVVDQARNDISVNVAESLQKQLDRQAKMVKDDPVGFAVERFQAQPDALDLSSPAAAQATIGQRVTIARGVAVEQGTQPGNPFRPAETAALAGAIGQGEPAKAASAFDALAGLPDDMLTPALGNPEIKAAVAGAARSTDGARFNGAMQFMDRLWSRSPETAKALFGEDQIHSLMTWQTNLRYMSPDQLSKERERAAVDPQVRERMKKNEAEGRELANKYSFDDVAKQFDTSWWITPGPLARATGSQPVAPTDALTRDAMMGDFVNLYARRYAETLDKDKAAEQATALMKTKWTASPTNGGRMMLNAPETIRDRSGNAVYPAVNGSHDWMTQQLQADIGAEIGKPMFDSTDPGAVGGANWSYNLVSDRRTQTEAQAGQPPSYVVVVRDTATDRDMVLPRRIRFDATEAQTKARTDFDVQRRRVLEGVVTPDLGNLGVP